MLKVGLVFEESDLKKFCESRRVEILVLPPGFSLDTQDCERRTGLICRSLSEFIEDGENSKFSKQLASAIRDLMSRLVYETIEATASQNDLSQYHLRLQWLYINALSRFLDKFSSVNLWFAVKPYSKYESPMRPDMGLFFSNARLMAYLAAALAEYRGIEISVLTNKKLSFYFLDPVLFIVRKTFLNIFIFFKLIEKIIKARYQSIPVVFEKCNLNKKTIGIVVRTDSEVISASYLIRQLERLGLPYVVIHDELLASTTTLKRLKTMEISSVSIGSMLGIRGLFQIYLAGKKSLELNPPASESRGFSDVEKVLIRNEAAMQHLKERLHDFYYVQRHFFIELNRIIVQRNIGLLVTYAYVDQWGHIIKSAGDGYGIKTLAIQNAAQDQEEYPRLCWADYYCVESMHFKKWLVSVGYPEEKICATGLPQYSSKSLSKINHQPNSDKQLLILTQPMYQDYYNALIESCIFFANKNDLKLAIKYHPRQVGVEYESVLQKYKNRITVKIFQNEPLDDLILLSSAVLSVSSATLVRSIVLGTPAISFYPIQERYSNINFINNRNLFVVGELEDLHALLGLMVNDVSLFQSQFKTKRKNYFAQHLSFEPTNCAEDNIMISIRKMLTTGG
jgi:hypothetical protein